ncbi:MAG TPA: hypothetical protein VK655_04895 [Solirubrobacteraceae bacterium]|nr:hypothetical protein [Solirubrobacteraceae bacterium]
MLESIGVRHQFGGAVALAWYRSPRATTDVDLNVTVPPDDADPVLGALAHLGVTVSPADRALIKRDGQARLDWDGSYLDVFFATFELHREMAEHSRQASFGPVHATSHIAPNRRFARGSTGRGVIDPSSIARASASLSSLSDVSFSNARMLSQPSAVGRPGA